MKCEKCGIEYEGSVCPTCGAAAPADLADRIMAKAKSLVTKKNVILAGAGLAVLIVLGVLSNLLFGGTGFDAYGAQVMAVPDDESAFHFLVGTKELKDTVEKGADYRLSSDGSVALVKDQENSLYMVSSSGVKKLDVSDVMSLGIVSPSLNALVYVTEGYEFYYLTTKNSKTVKLGEGSLSSLVISPDGKSLLYLNQVDGEYKMYFFDGKESTYIGKGVTPLALSNGGKYIYAYGDGKLWSYSKKGGDKEKIGDYSSNYTIYMNESHTEILFSDGEKTYYSAKCGDAVKVSGNTTTGCIAPENTVRSATARVTTVSTSKLLNCLWKSGGNLYAFSKNGERSKLIANVSSVVWSRDGSYLAWTGSDGTLCRCTYQDGKVGEEETVTEDGVKSFAISADGTYVYYTDSGKDLYGSKNGGKPKMIAEDIDSFVMSAKDVLFYTVDGDLYACSNGRSGKMVKADVVGARNAGTTFVAMNGESELFVSSGGTGLKRVFKSVELGY